MSITLQYDAKCSECGKRMRPGTEAVFFKDGKNTAYAHVGDCPTAPEPKPRSQPDARERFDLRECAGGCNFAYERGTAPKVCSCGSEWAWTGDEGWLDEVAA